MPIIIGFVFDENRLIIFPSHIVGTRPEKIKSNSFIIVNNMTHLKNIAKIILTIAPSKTNVQSVKTKP